MTTSAATSPANGRSENGVHPSRCQSILHDVREYIIKPACWSRMTMSSRNDTCVTTSPPESSHDHHDAARCRRLPRPWPRASPACSRPWRRRTCRRARWPTCCSAVRSLCRVLGQPPARSRPIPGCSAGPCAVPCPPPPASPPPVGPTSRAWCCKALALTGCKVLPGRSLHPLTPAWAALDGPAAGQVLRAALSRLMHYCSAQGIPPRRRRPGGVRSLRSGDHARQLHPQPARRPPDRGPAVEPGGRHDPGLAAAAPSCSPATPSPTRCGWTRSRPRSRPRSSSGCAGSPARVRSTRGRCGRCGRARSSSAGSICARPPRPWCRAAAIPPASPASADLVTVEAMQAILRFFLARSGNRPTSQIHGLATHLKAIARHHVGVTPAVLEQLGRMVRRVAPPQTGLALKNRLALKQFEDPVLLGRLVRLPDEVYATLPPAGHAAAAAHGAALPVGPGGAAPARRPDPARQPRRARARPAPAASRQRQQRLRYQPRDPRRGGQERPADRAAAAGRDECPARALPHPGAAGAGAARHQLAVPGRDRWPQGAGHPGRPDQPLSRTRARRAAHPASVPPSGRLRLSAPASARSRGGPRPARPSLDQHHHAPLCRTRRGGRSPAL